MPTQVGVSLRAAGSLHYFDPGELDLETGDWVLVPTPLGLELGQVVLVVQTPDAEPAKDLPQVQCRAQEQDFQQHHRSRLQAAEALAFSRERVRHHGLAMKMLQAEASLDGHRILLYFSAESRVDFRVLIRDLSTTLHKRIELRQVGPRDRSALTGGLGLCGRECCCSSWTREFYPVSIKMAKEQNLSLNPSKISGSCGRLMCCLRYEHQTYRELRRGMPRVGEALDLPEGKVRVVAVNLGRCSLKVEHPEEGTYEIPPERVKELGLGLTLPAPTARRTPEPARPSTLAEEKESTESTSESTRASRRPQERSHPSTRPGRETPAPTGRSRPETGSEPSSRKRPRKGRSPQPEASAAAGQPAKKPEKRRPRRGAGRPKPADQTTPVSAESPVPEARPSGRSRRRGRARRPGGRRPGGPAPEKPPESA
ncbi:MAG: regulatory iron-sulfur-containing complex subunit RicT [Candidatus Xenobium sp.]|jgi:cell fate regulator YaaT (PSP1 superfamily)|nr:hypothetical protein [Burkholderiales bacterium]